MNTNKYYSAIDDIYLDDISWYDVISRKICDMHFWNILRFKNEIAGCNAKIQSNLGTIDGIGQSGIGNGRGICSIQRLEKEIELWEITIRHNNTTIIGIKKMIVVGNLRLVFNAAKKTRVPSHLHMDMIEEGNFGLVRSIDKFDVTMGWCFSTYAYTVILNEMRNKLNSQSMVLTRGTIARCRLYNKARDACTLNGEQPDDDKMLAWLRANSSPSATYSKKSLRTLERNEKMRMSLSLEHRDDLDSEFQHCLSVSDNEQERFSQNKLNKVLDAMDRHLDSRYRGIMLCRFIDNNTLKETGLMFDITKERVRQIVTKCLIRLKQVIGAGREQEVPLSCLLHPNDLRTLVLPDQSCQEPVASL